MMGQCHSNFAHFAIPKTGTRSLRHIINQTMNESDVPEFHIMLRYDSIILDYETNVYCTSLPSCFFRPKIITIIREPIQRLLSEYIFVHKHPTSNGFMNWSVHSYRHNSQLAFLSGFRSHANVCKQYIYPQRADLLNLMKRWQSKTLVIGVFEKYFLSVKLLLNALGVSVENKILSDLMERYYKTNRIWHKQDKIHLNAFSVNILKRVNSLDLELYNNILQGLRSTNFTYTKTFEAR